MPPCFENQVRLSLFALVVGVRCCKDIGSMSGADSKRLKSLLNQGQLGMQNEKVRAELNSVYSF